MTWTKSDMVKDRHSPHLWSGNESTRERNSSPKESFLVDRLCPCPSLQLFGFYSDLDCRRHGWGPCLVQLSGNETRGRLRTWNVCKIFSSSPEETCLVRTLYWIGNHSKASHSRMGTCFLELPNRHLRSGDESLRDSGPEDVWKPSLWRNNISSDWSSYSVCDYSSSFSRRRKKTRFRTLGSVFGLETRIWLTSALKLR